MVSAIVTTLRAQWLKIHFVCTYAERASTRMRQRIDVRSVYSDVPLALMLWLASHATLRMLWTRQLTNATALVEQYFSSQASVILLLLKRMPALEKIWSTRLTVHAQIIVHQDSIPRQLIFVDPVSRAVLLAPTLMLAEAARMDLLSTLQAVHVTVKAGNSSLLIEHSVSTSVEKHIFHLMSLKNAIPALTAVKVVPQIQFALSVM